MITLEVSTTSWLLCVNVDENDPFPPECDHDFRYGPGALYYAWTCNTETQEIREQFVFIADSDRTWERRAMNRLARGVEPVPYRLLHR